MSLEHEVGPIHYTLELPPLDEAGYAKLQAAVMAPILYPRRRRPWRNLAIVLVVGSVVGGLGGYLSSRWSLAGQMWVGSFETGEGWELDGAEIFLSAAGLVLLSLLLAIILLRLNHRGMLRRLHGASASLLAGQKLEFGEHGILARNQGRASVNLWSRVTGLLQAPGYHFIVVDHASAFWLPESLLASLPDREGFLRFLKARIGQPAGIAPLG